VHNAYLVQNITMETLIYVKAFPSAKKEKVVKNTDTSFDIYIREPAQRNLANQRIRACVAEEFDIPLAQVVMQTGHRTRKKTFIIKK